jgi:hypothetical protein
VLKDAEEQEAVDDFERAHDVARAARELQDAPKREVREDDFSLG